MKEKPRPTFSPCGHVVLRTPLLPLAALDGWGGGPDDVAGARRALDALLARPVVAQAIALASPQVSEGIALWRKEPDSERGKKLERALVAYVERLASRPTPFGLFAGVTLGAVGRRTELRLRPLANYRRKTRLDMGALHALCERLLEKPEIRSGVLFRPNETVLEVGERVHFVKGRQEKKTRRYELAAADASPALAAVVSAATSGKTMAELREVVKKEEPEATEAEVADFIEQLVREQLLLPDLRPMLTVRDAAEELVEQLRALPAAEAEASALARTLTELAAVDAAPLDAGNASLAPAQAALERIEVTAEPGKLFQVDLYKPADKVELSLGLVRSLLRATELLAAVFRGRDELAEAREQFVRRYESAEVPLLEALDAELGIGFVSGGMNPDGSPLLDDIVFSPEPESRPSGNAAVETWLEDLHARGLASPQKEVEITEAELERLGRGPGLPESFSIMATLLGPSLTEGDGPVALLIGPSGPPSESLTARFCWLDSALAQVAMRATSAEECLRPETIFADIVHSPEGRVGNIIARPALRQTELPLLGRSGAAPEHQLQLSDLVLSVREGRFVLRSVSRGLEVVPRLTNRHDSSQGFPLYHFLCLLQQAGTSEGRGFHWGRLQGAAFLPRVRLGRLIIAPARFSLSEGVLKALTGPSDLRALARHLGWPRFVRCRDSDHTLPVDLENSLSVHAMLETYRQRPSAVVEEDLQRLVGSPVASAEGAFANEVCVSFRADQRLVPPVDKPAESGIVRGFAPGDEWLYVRLYAAPASADRLLSEVVAPLVKAARAAGRLSRWFFIRYSDPDHHLRLRFSGDPAWLVSEFLPNLRAGLTEPFATGQANRLELGTYLREVERYGGPAGMEACEEWFEADSDTVLALLPLLRAVGALDLRWRLALVAMRDSLDVLGLVPEEQILLLARSRDGFARGAGDGPALETSLAKKYRAERAAIERLLVGSAPVEFAPALASLAERREKLTKPAKTLAEARARGSLLGELGDLAGSLLHMDINRLLRSAQNAHEVVLYDLLRRHLQATSGRSRKERE